MRNELNNKKRIRDISSRQKAANALLTVSWLDFKGISFHWGSAPRKEKLLSLEISKARNRANNLAILFITRIFTFITLCRPFNNYKTVPRNFHWISPTSNFSSVCTSRKKGGEGIEERASFIPCRDTRLRQALSRVEHNAILPGATSPFGKNALVYRRYRRHLDKFRSRSTRRNKCKGCARSNKTEKRRTREEKDS